jgi:inosose dehydratase
MSRMRIATAPVSFGVFELTVDGRPLPPPDVLLDHVAEVGYEGIELGPPGYFGDGPAAAHALEERGLALVGAFLPLRLSRHDAFGADFEWLQRSLELLDRTTPDVGERPHALLSDAFCEPDRMALAGRIDHHPEAWLGERRFQLLADNAQRAAELCREMHFTPAFHHHAGSYVETPREIDRFVQLVDPELLPLCFDTGHAAFGGGDPVAQLREYAEIVEHVHLKDVDRKVMDEVRARCLGLEEAWQRDAFCALGRGSIDIAAVLKTLREIDYTGWLVVEQDRVLREGVPLEALLADSTANLAYLHELGLAA